MIIYLALLHSVLSIQDIDPYVINTISIQNIQPQNRALFSQNKHNALKVEKVFREKGFTDPKALMAIHANAWHESKFDPNCVAGSFVGIFQIGGRGTMGHGTTVSQRKDIRTSVNIVASKDYFVSWYKEVKYRDLSVERAARTFASKVLRCAPQHYEARSLTSRRWSGRTGR